MIFVVDKNADLNNNIVFRIDAWQMNASTIVAEWIADNGYEFICEEITFMGDKVVWVKGV